MSSVLHRAWPALYQAAIVVGLCPALAWAQQPSGPMSGPAPENNPTSPGPGGSHAGWPWIVAAIVVLAIVWWAMAYRRRDRLPR